ncbi:MAG: hypothetical protein JNM39_05495 [Bdellovibrionaceae bacterium]|nr:hypothetical protein [Pseudobdellovibrionaceae bacterium]
MRLTQISLLLLIIFFESSSFTQSTPKFIAKEFVDGLATSILSSLGQKLRELNQTYPSRIPRTSGARKSNVLAFNAYGLKVCDKPEFYGLVTSITATSKFDNGKLSQNFSYKGCNQEVVQFEEVLTTKGGTQAPLTGEQILGASRVFTLQGEEEYRKYSVYEGSEDAKREVFSFQTEGSNTRSWRTSITFRGLLVASIQVWNNPSGEIADIKKHAVSYMGMSSGQTISIDDSSTFHYAISFLSGDQIYRDQSKLRRVGLDDMRADLEDILRAGWAIKGFKASIDRLMSGFPSSAPVATTSLFGKELTLAQSWFQADPNNPANSQRMLNLLSLWQDELNKGTIRDSRPAQ